MFRVIKRKNSLHTLFYPKSIAIIGASNDVNKIGGYIFSQIKSQDKIETIPINIKEESVQGLKSYKSVLDYNNKIDLAVIVIPGSFVIDTLQQCAQKKIKNVIIISAGFKETGEEGRKKEQKIKQIVKQNNMNLIGPNCLGILNVENKLNLSFAKDIPAKGDVALISQSGAVIDAIIDWSFKYNVGFSKIVSLGNMAGVDELEMLEFLKNDPKTKSIVFYMETLEKGKQFATILKEISKTKPVIIIKPGNSDNAKKAIGSHTGSLAQNNILVKTLIKQSNGIVVNNLNELFDTLICLKSKYNKNNKIVIVTNAGGPGVITTDIVSESNFELYKFNDKQKLEFNQLPKEASLNNPIDILGDAKSDRYEYILNQLEKIDDVSNICVLLTPQIMTDSLDIAKILVNHVKKSKKNIFSCFLGDKEIKSAVQYFNKENFPNYETPINAIVAQNYFLNYKNFNYANKVQRYSHDKNEIHKLKDEIFMKQGLLDYELTKKILNLFSIKLPKKIIIKSLQDLDKVKLNENKKYVLKVDSKDLIHKKDVGGVILGIDNSNYKQKIKQMFDTIAIITKKFYLTLETEAKGTEVIIGLKKDDNLGNFLMFGAGGTYVSVFKDINFTKCPMSLEDAKQLVDKSKINTILKGYRGSKSIDYEHLYELLIRMSYLQEIFPEIREVDLNPVICNDKGVFLADVKLII